MDILEALHLSNSCYLTGWGEGRYVPWNYHGPQNLHVFRCFFLWEITRFLGGQNLHCSWFWGLMVANSTWKLMVGRWRVFFLDAMFFFRCYDSFKECIHLEKVEVMDVGRCSKSRGVFQKWQPGTPNHQFKTDVLVKQPFTIGCLGFDLVFGLGFLFDSTCPETEAFLGGFQLP